ncbi:hypothetical protein [Asaia bogorensis]|uniref:hypothetical protein n=1 Tax=Asaia bogorensis TaxID=91915 RepID=UPI00285E34BB|nr:hypothetical protein [Asaia bogorensis]MDR6183524.1 uncharacterized protein involved in tolerance to divalent cations [Asaia bogorensis NBRC 16594]
MKFRHALHAIAHTLRRQPECVRRIENLIECYQAQEASQYKARQMASSVLEQKLARCSRLCTGLETHKNGFNNLVQTCPIVGDHTKAISQLGATRDQRGNFFTSQFVFLNYRLKKSRDVGHFLFKTRKSSFQACKSFVRHIFMDRHRNILFIRKRGLRMYYYWQGRESSLVQNEKESSIISISKNMP